MSFILDALRKSEHDRQREKGPGLAEVAVSPPKPKKNVWATVAVGLLVINLLAVGVLLLRRAGQHSNATVTNTTATGGAATGAGTDTLDAPQPTPDPPVAAATGAAPMNPRTVPGTVPPVLQPALPADEAGGTHNPLTDELSGGAAGDDNYDAGYEGGYPAEGSPYPTAPPGVNGPPGVSGPPSQRGSVVYENLPEADPITSPSHAAANAAGAAAADTNRDAGHGSSLPTLDELGGQTGLPELHVDLHVYSTKPEERFVFVNSRRYKEGDTLQEGPHVDRITPGGAELSYQGNRFVLPRQ